MPSTDPRLPVTDPLLSAIADLKLTITGSTGKLEGRLDALEDKIDTLTEEHKVLSKTDSALETELKLVKQAFDQAAKERDSIRQEWTAWRTTTDQKLAKLSEQNSSWANFGPILLGILSVLGALTAMWKAFH